MSFLRPTGEAQLVPARKRNQPYRIVLRRRHLHMLFQISQRYRQGTGKLLVREPPESCSIARALKRPQRLGMGRDRNLQRDPSMGFSGADGVMDHPYTCTRVLSETGKWLLDEMKHGRANAVCSSMGGVSRAGA